eukprot:1604678-Rhodomonas_salina.2
MHTDASLFVLIALWVPATALAFGVTGAVLSERDGVSCSGTLGLFGPEVAHVHEIKPKELETALCTEDLSGDEPAAAEPPHRAHGRHVLGHQRAGSSEGSGSGVEPREIK